MFIDEQERKRQGQNTYVPESKPKAPPRNLSKEKRDRMVSYGRKVTGFSPLTFNLKRPVVKKIDYNDIKNRTSNDVSEVGRMVAYKQSCIQTETKEIQKFLNNAFKGMKHTRAASKKEQRIQNEKEITEALKDIKQKYFSSAMMKKKPNMQVASVLDLANNSSNYARQNSHHSNKSALSARTGFNAN